tara:strand:- start:35350 stop:35664 length:315 start_codon:yes stop_codon:yes gene_type:complete
VFGLGLVYSELYLFKKYQQAEVQGMSKAIGSLKLGKPSLKQETLGGVGLQNTALVKAKLLEELVELEAQMERLKAAGDAVDFSMMQTYKEMIHSRKTFYKELDN